VEEEEVVEQEGVPEVDVVAVVVDEEAVAVVEEGEVVEQEGVPEVAVVAVVVDVVVDEEAVAVVGEEAVVVVVVVDGVDVGDDVGDVVDVVVMFCNIPGSVLEETSGFIKNKKQKDLKIIFIFTFLRTGPVHVPYPLVQ